MGGGVCAPQPTVCEEGLVERMGGMVLPTPPFCFLPLSSSLSPSHKLPCGQIWFNFLCPLKGNETSGGDLRESKHEDVSNGDVAACM